MPTNQNLDPSTVKSFGDEWERFTQQPIDDTEAITIFDDYFHIFPWDQLPPDAEGFDMGCGSGRWANLVAPRVRKLHCVDPSQAIHVAEQLLSHHSNVVFHNSSLDNITLQYGSQDFGYSLGVLHHVPNTAEAIASCVSLLKPGAPFLLYLYYKFDNKPSWYQSLWQLSNYIRLFVSRLPSGLKQIITDSIALSIYWPLSRSSRILEMCGIPVENIPLSYYRHSSIYTLRTDSRDRFGTPLEQRFTLKEILTMCTKAGLTDLNYSNRRPYWCVVGFKR